jgi:hypothetical protein
MSAHVQSIVAIPEFRAALCTFIIEARQALAAMEMEARRALEYITHDQAAAWQGEARRSRESVAQCNLAIHNARTFKRIGEYIPSCIDEKKELEKAERRVKVADQKVEAVRHWSRVSEQAVREFQARLAQFVSMLDGDLPKAVAALERILTSLDRYLVVDAPAAAREGAISTTDHERSMRMPDDEEKAQEAAEGASAGVVSSTDEMGSADGQGPGESQARGNTSDVVPEELR